MMETVREAHKEQVDSGREIDMDRERRKQQGETTRPGCTKDILKKGEMIAC